MDPDKTIVRLNVQYITSLPLFHASPPLRKKLPSHTVRRFAVTLTPFAFLVSPPLSLAPTYLILDH